MQRILFSFLILCSLSVSAQSDTTKWMRAFPITDYMVDLNDSTKVVQLEMPDGLAPKDKQLGVMYGVYNGSRDESVEKGYGRCNLIKGNYYYFSIGHNKSGLPLKKGDLVYLMMDKTPIYYGRIPQLAAHFIRLQDVYENALYDRYIIFSNWTKADENKLVDSLVADIRFTGQYFMQNDPSMDKPITTGDYKGQQILKVMTLCYSSDVNKFLDYMIARPRLYAGRDWKIAEVFATWLSEGAPTVLKN